MLEKCSYGMVFGPPSTEPERFLNFIHDDFLLHSKAARRLYHDYAEAEPILDFHSHLPGADVAEDRRFEDLSEIWLN